MTNSITGGDHHIFGPFESQKANSEGIVQSNNVLRHGNSVGSDESWNGGEQSRRHVKKARKLWMERKNKGRPRQSPDMINKKECFNFLINRHDAYRP